MTLKEKIVKCYKSRKLVIVIFILALFIGCVGYVKFANISVNYYDALEYKKLGKEVASGAWLTSQYFGMIRTPGYPIILGSVYTIFGEDDIYVKAIQIIICSITAALIFYLGIILFSRLVGLLSAVWYITYYDFIRTSFILLRETWITFFILLTLLFFTLYSKSRKLRCIIIGSLSFGCLVLIDPRYSFFLFIILMFVSFFSKNWQYRMRDLIMSMLGIMVFLIPWAVHQSRINDRVVIFSPYYDAKIISFIGAHSAAHEGDKDNTYEVKRDEYLSGVAVYLHRFIDYWRFARFKTDIRARDDIKYRSAWGLSKNLSNILHVGLLLPFIFIGFYLIIKMLQLPQLFILSLLIYHMVFHLLICYLYRYRLPILPLFFLIGWYGVTHVTRKIAERKLKKHFFGSNRTAVI